MPLTQPIHFQTVLEKGNRLQIPKLIQYKIDPNQVLNVSLNPRNSWASKSNFYAKMDKQGRVFIPKLTMTCLVKEKSQNLVGNIFEVTLQPA